MTRKASGAKRKKSPMPPLCLIAYPLDVLVFKGHLRLKQGLFQGVPGAGSVFLSHYLEGRLPLPALRPRRPLTHGKRLGSVGALRAPTDPRRRAGPRWD